MPAHSSQSSCLSCVLLGEFLIKLADISGFSLVQDGIFQWCIFQLAVIPYAEIGRRKRDAVKMYMLDSALGVSSVFLNVLYAFYVMDAADQFLGNVHTLT